MEGMVRTIKFATEERLQKKIQVDEPLFYWFVEHAADLIIKFQRGRDGRTAYERLKRKPFKSDIQEFGSMVHHHVPGKPGEAR